MAIAGGRREGGADRDRLTRRCSDPARREHVDRCAGHCAALRGVGRQARGLRSLCCGHDRSGQALLVARSRGRLRDPGDLSAAGCFPGKRRASHPQDLAPGQRRGRACEERTRRGHRARGQLRGRRRLCGNARRVKSGTCGRETRLHRRRHDVPLYRNLAQRLRGFKHAVPVHREPLHGLAGGCRLAGDGLVFRRRRVSKPGGSALHRGDRRGGATRAQRRLRLGARAAQLAAAGERDLFGVACGAARQLDAFRCRPAPRGRPEEIQRRVDAWLLQLQRRNKFHERPIHAGRDRAGKQRFRPAHAGRRWQFLRIARRPFRRRHFMRTPKRERHLFASRCRAAAPCAVPHTQCREPRQEDRGRRILLRRFR